MYRKITAYIQIKRTVSIEAKTGRNTFVCVHVLIVLCLGHLIMSCCGLLIGKIGNIKNIGTIEVLRKSKQTDELGHLNIRRVMTYFKIYTYLPL